MQPAGAPPPYPGTNDPGAYPPPNPAYPPGPPGHYDPSKPPADPQMNQYYWQQGYNQPGVPGGGYSQPYPPTSQPMAYSGATTVVVSQPAVTVVQSYRESPVHTNCPHCRAEIVTGIHYETGTLAWVICCVLWWIGCGLGCCLIPFCVDGCKDVIHTCPNCHQQIARFSRM